MTGERAGVAAPIEPVGIDQITDEAHLAADDPRRFGEQRRRNFTAGSREASTRHPLKTPRRCSAS